MMRLSLSLSLLATVSLVACGEPKGDPDDVAQTRPPAAAPIGASGSLSVQTIESAAWSDAPSSSTSGTTQRQPTTATAPGVDPATPAATAQPRPEIIRAQVLLERARFSPGVIDGLGGENTRQAVAAFEEANQLPVDGELDARVFSALTGASGAVMTEYAITAEDVAGPFIAQVPGDLAAQAALPALSYTSAREALAEKFHVTETLLAALNPGVDFARAGQRIVVPAVADRPLAAEVARIVVNKADNALRAFDADGNLLAFYPATIGSSERPAPSGRVTVVGVANEPDYTYDPRRVTYDRGDRRMVVAAGPNNPVGSVWIDLSRDTYGIHGTPDPSKIAKTASNGCVRLTNWSAEQLAAAVKPGVVVEFV